MNINRPISPHLTVYALGLTGYASVMHRITGAALSIALCAFVIVLKIFSFHLTTYLVYSIMHTVNLYTNILLLVVGLAIIFAFVYHFLTGIRHLIWDTGVALEIYQIDMSAKIVVGLATTLTVILWMIF